MKKAFPYLVFVCLGVVAFYVGGYLETYNLNIGEKFTTAKGIINQQVLEEVEGTSIEAEMVPKIIKAPTSNTSVTPPTINTFTPRAPTVPVHYDDTNALDDFNARQAEECQRKTEAYARCVGDFNSEMNKYLACQQVNDDAKERYNGEMESYSRCMGDYQDDLNNYYKCLEHAASSLIGGTCSKPTMMFCHKPMNPYSQYCNKPTNFCTKPYCY